MRAPPTGKSRSIARWLSLFAMIALAVAASVAFFVHNWGFALDDSYITYRYAQNFADGFGLRFNVAEAHFGSTAMGIAVLYGAISAVLDAAFQHAIVIENQIATRGVLIPVIAAALSAASTGASMLLVFSSAARRIGHLRAWLVALPLGVALFSWEAFNNVSGHETSVYLVLLLLALWLLFDHGRPIGAGVILALASTVRPDCVLMFAVVLALMALRSVMAPARAESRHALFRFLASFVAVYVPWLVFCAVYYGSPLPQTLLAKHAQTALGAWEHYDIGLIVSKTILLLGVPALALTLIASLAGPSILLLHKRSLRALLDHPSVMTLTAMLAFAVGQVLFYTLLDVTYWRWYLVPILYSLLVAGASGASVLFETLQDRGQIRVYAIAALSALAVCLAFAGPQAAAQFRTVVTTSRPNPHVTSYDGIAEYLLANEPNGTVVATAEPGALGFKLGPKFTVVDELGLVSPDVAAHILSGDMDYPFRRWSPKYIIVSYTGPFSPENRPWFNSQYEKVGEFNDPFWMRALNHGAYLYRRLDSAGAWKP